MSHFVLAIGFGTDHVSYKALTERAADQAGGIMRHFALTLTPGRHVALSAEVRDALGVAPGERLTLVVDDAGHATLEKPDALFSLRGIARRARARPPAPSDDPIGDYLLTEDERTKSGQ
ncbi:hypothetical protein DA075_28990 [Methylobacterium currus]|uniref:AbrB/MazE/SpoVT family DNA-binding domain-containing protein n=1 Tax=Methylobacterium currus TaxID=2051553 RepID=A0A2R4WS91_9HYPH|nr:AbrB/MazE/SpoVT family DNA-binding domain-containing protein [Methylobacterium currus]AWB24411.1 hypothetical protein DA075_28990 [Methylobacterium currus]